MDIETLMTRIFQLPLITAPPWKGEHKLSDILLLTICAVISGADG
ncbi:Uncharacterised protein [Salmonella enterica]|nr:Uncharacterised protein [Salmonella enterica]